MPSSYESDRSKNIAAQLKPHLRGVAFSPEGITVPITGERARELHLQLINGVIVITIPDAQGVLMETRYATVIIPGAAEIINSC